MSKAMMILPLVTVSWLLCLAPAMAQSTDFTYQGQLHDGDTPADGVFDFQFKLFDMASAGAQQGATVCLDDVPVNSGLFTLQLDFGVDVFNGSDRWLEIATRADSTPANCNSGGYTTLSPRQPITAAPYALQTRGLIVDPAENVGIGTAPQARLHVDGDFRIDDGVMTVRSGGVSVYQMINTSPGLADLHNNRNTGGLSTALGTSNDGSGFLDVYGKNSATLTAELDGDIDQNGSNGIDAGGLFLRSIGTGGTGGKITVQNNGGLDTVTVSGGVSGASATVSLLNTTGQTAVRLTGDVNSLGGEVRTNDASGNSQSVVQPDFNGGGTYASWSRNTGSNGLIYDGNTSSSGNPTLTLNSSVSPVTFSTNATGNAAVVLPNDAIAATEIMNEAGVANNHTGSTAMPTSTGPLISRSITVPAAGYVLALAEGDLEIHHITGTATNCSYGVSQSASSLPSDQDVQTQLPSGLPTGTYDFAASAHGLFSVNSAGSYTFYFSGLRAGGGSGVSATMFDVQLTLAYFPTAYGTVTSNTIDSGAGSAGNSDANIGSPLTVEAIAAEKAESIAFNQARLQSELDQMRADMAAMQAHLAQVEDEQASMEAAFPMQSPTSSLPNTLLGRRR